MKNRMYRIVFCLILSLPIWKDSQAQKTYFVYLQSEQQQPFYVLFNSNNYRSSPAGYLIIPKLTDGTYPIKLGFPNNPDVQSYDLQVRGDDAGYIVKKVADKGWGLSDLQSGTVQINGVEQEKRAAVANANKELEEKRIADSVQQAMAQAAALKASDSLLAAEKQRNAAAIDTTTRTQPTAVAAVPVENAVPVPANTEAAKMAENPVGEKAANPVVPVVVTDEAAASNFKSEATEAAPVAATPNESTAETKRIADSLNILAAQKRADSIRTDAANREAQQKIDEAREVMNRVLGTSSQPATTSAVAPVAAKEANTIPAESQATTSKAETDAEGVKQAVPPSDSSVYKEIAKTPAAVPVPASKPTTKETTAPATKSGNPKFLDMEMGPDAEVGASKTATPVEKSAEEVKSTKKADTKKSNGLTSNNSTTKIVEVPAPAAAAATEQQVQSQQKAVNKNCEEEASEKDFFTLRKKMAADDDPDDMLSTARKAFKEKCYSSFQVKNLCVLFLTDENKYRFLDMAYTHTTDQQNFKGLGELLSDSYFVNRFNAMIRN